MPLTGLNIMDFTNYFQQFETPEALRAAYRAEAMKHHPDRGGDKATMQAINAAYARAEEMMMKDTERTRRAERAAAGTARTADNINLDEVGEAVYNAIMAALNLEGVEVEITGLWVWATGNTKPNKEQLKTAGYRWSGPKQAWYFAGVPSSSRGGFSMERIRSTYGSSKYRRANVPLLNEAQ